MNASDIRPGWQLPLQWPRAADHGSVLYAPLAAPATVYPSAIPQPVR